MESSSFNLKQSIDIYVGLINKQGSITGSDQDELIGHLYDSVEALHKQGLSEEESFMIACKRIGKVETISEEYSKVNTSVKSNKVWTYIGIGIIMFYGVSSITSAAIKTLYFTIYRQYGTSGISVFLVTVIHLIFTLCIWSVVRYKSKIGKYIEKQVDQRPLAFTGLSCLPATLAILFLPALYRLMPDMSISYPLYKFSSGVIEFTFYLSAISIIGMFLSVVFSVKKLENSMIKTLFQRPSIGFLILFGFTLELIAASNRALQADIMIEAMAFGIIYAAGAFIISYYNEVTNANKYILIAMSLGLILEVSVGISADLGRGNTYFTVYFATALIFGVLLGRFLGTRLSLNTDVDHSKIMKIEAN